ncbi:MAG: hypothetical protein EBY41_02105 [Proteobacteria bacterium]|nr:hypothetical protein [Pseudomonadota bacterium]
MISRLVDTELRSFATARHVNSNDKSIRIFSPSENESYLNTSLYLDLICSSNCSLSSNCTKKSI